jgi:hypothetical protein
VLAELKFIIVTAALHAALRCVVTCSSLLSRVGKGRPPIYSVPLDILYHRTVKLLPFSAECRDATCQLVHGPDAQDCFINRPSAYSTR